MLLHAHPARAVLAAFAARLFGAAEARLSATIHVRLSLILQTVFASGRRADLPLTVAASTIGSHLAAPPRGAASTMRASAVDIRFLLVENTVATRCRDAARVLADLALTITVPNAAESQRAAAAVQAAAVQIAFHTIPKPVVATSRFAGASDAPVAQAVVVDAARFWGGAATGRAGFTAVGARLQAVPHAVFAGRRTTVPVATNASRTIRWDQTRLTRHARPAAAPAIDIALVAVQKPVRAVDAWRYHQRVVGEGTTGKANQGR